MQRRGYIRRRTHLKDGFDHSTDEINDGLVADGFSEDTGLGAGERLTSGDPRTRLGRGNSHGCCTVDMSSPKKQRDGPCSAISTTERHRSRVTRCTIGTPTPGTETIAPSYRG